MGGSRVWYVLLQYVKDLEHQYGEVKKLKPPKQNKNYVYWP